MEPNQGSFGGQTPFQLINTMTTNLQNTNEWGGEGSVSFVNRLAKDHRTKPTCVNKIQRKT